MNVKLFSSSLALFDIRREYTPSRPPIDIFAVRDRDIFQS